MQHATQQLTHATAPARRIPGTSARAYCACCGGQTAALCDARDASGRRCARPLCARCAEHLPNGRDLCPACAAAERGRQQAVDGLAQPASRPLALPPWQRRALAGISDPLEQPHPIDDGLPRRFWRGWHYAVLIACEPRADWHGHLAQVPAQHRAAAARHLRWRADHAIDAAALCRAIVGWESEHAARQRSIERARRRGKR